MVSRPLFIYFARMSVYILCAFDHVHNRAQYFGNKMQESDCHMIIRRLLLFVYAYRHTSIFGGLRNIYDLSRLDDHWRMVITTIRSSSTSYIMRFFWFYYILLNLFYSTNFVAFSIMVKLPKIPDTPEDFNDVVAYLQSGVFAPQYNTSTKRKNLRRRCQDLTYDNKSGCLFYTEKPTDENSQLIKKRIIPTYDKELREALLEKFHIGASHFEYHKTYTMLYEKHIGITQSEVKAFVQKCPTCIRNVTIKEKTDITPIIASAPLERVSGLFRLKTKREVR